MSKFRPSNTQGGKEGNTVWNHFILENFLELNQRFVSSDVINGIYTSNITESSASWWRIRSSCRCLYLYIVWIIYTLPYAFFWVIPRRLNFIHICRRFGTLYLFHLHRRIDIKDTYPPTKMEPLECSETSDYKIETLGNYQEGRIQHSEHGESLKSRMFMHSL